MVTHLANEAVLPLRVVVIGAPHLFVVVISANNTRYHEEERTSNGHFIHGAFQKMAAENASNFAKEHISSKF